MKVFKGCQFGSTAAVHVVEGDILVDHLVVFVQMLEEMNGWVCLFGLYLVAAIVGGGWFSIIEILNEVLDG